VAFDLEWNSKDQTFDRDLYAFRAFHECDLIDAAVLLTRSASLNAVFEKLGAELDEKGKPRTDKNGKPKLIKSKYGASTTWMGKLIYRLNAGRHGGCPLLALGITPNLITDWAAYEEENR
jgi:CRISPR-associated protein Csd2